MPEGGGMFGKKENTDVSGEDDSVEAPVTKPRKPARRGAVSLAHTGITTAIVMTGLVLVGGISQFMIQLAELNSVRERQVTVGAEGLAGRLSDRMSHYDKILNTIADSQEIAVYYLEKDQASLDKKAAQIMALIPDAKSIRFLPHKLRTTDESMVPPISYASMELVNRAAKSATPPRAEIHQFGQKHQHVAFAKRIIHRRTNTVIGVLQVTFPISVLQHSVDGVKEYGGHVEIRQTELIEDGIPLVLAGNGKLRSPEDEPDGSVKIPGTIWEVGYWTEPITMSQWMSYGAFWLVLFVVTALVAVVTAIQFTRIARLLKADQVALVSIVDDFSKGKTPRSVQTSLKEMSGTVELIRQLCAENLHKKVKEKHKNIKDKGKSKPGLELDDELFPSPAAKNASRKRVAKARADETTSAPVRSGGGMMPAEIFRAYDIRGVVGESLTPDIVYEIGRAIGSEAFDRGEQTVIVARDGRLSGPSLSDKLIKGLLATGRDVIDLGQVPTPVLYFATHFLGSNSGVMLTGSHNPVNYNGLKIVLRGETLSGNAIYALKERIESGNIFDGDGSLTTQDLLPDYIARINEDVHLSRKLKVVVDCGNGVAGVAAPQLLRSLGCDVVEMFCDVDGNFPNHHPDPSKPDNLQALILAVQAEEADLGLAFDGDGDRVGVVDATGVIIWPDRLLMLLAADVLSRQPGADIIYDVKCTRNLAAEIIKCGGRPVMWKTGHSYIKAKMKESGALLAGEMSGHIFFKERWYGFDDAMYTAARLLEILSNETRSSAEIFGELPDSYTTPELGLNFREGENVEIMNQLLAKANFPDANVITIDGMRVETDSGWGLVRASNTTPSLVFRFESSTEQGLEQIKSVFRNLLKQVRPSVKLPF